MLPGARTATRLVADRARHHRIGAQVLDAFDVAAHAVVSKIAMSSGRMPSMTSRRRVSPSLPFRRRPRRRARDERIMFIGGVPMKRAANTVAGRA